MLLNVLIKASDMLGMWKKLIAYVIRGLSLIFVSFSFQSVWASPKSLTYQGRILKANGSPLEFNNVSFIFELTSPNGSCVIYREQKSGINMANSGGVFDVAIGTGSRQFPPVGTTTVADYFSNSKTYDCGDTANQDSGSDYVASQGDGRKLRVSFWDGSGWQLISPDNEIRSVPFAAYSLSAEKVGDIASTDLALKSQLPAQDCDAGKVLTFSGGTFSCIVDQLGAAGGGIQSIAGDTSTAHVLAVGTAGTAPAWSHSGGVHTLNIPFASSMGVTAGLISKAQYDVLSAKQNALGFTPLSPANNLSDLTDASAARTNLGLATAGGDLSGIFPNPTVEKIRNQSITAQGSVAGQVLRYAGSGNWTPGFVAMTDLRSSVTGSNSFATSCGPQQTLTYNSVGDLMSCQSISITKSQVSDFPALGALASKASVDLSSADASGILAAARFPALTGDVTTTSGTVATTIANNAVTNAKFRQGAGLSVVGVAGNTMANVADIQGVANQVLRVDGAGTALAFGALDVSSNAAVTGTLPVANGGIGANTLALNNVVLGNGTGPVKAVAPGTSGNILTSNGTTWVSQAPTAVGRTSCPAGFTLVGTSGSADAFCISTNKEANATWLGANQNCRSKSPKALLCSSRQWLAACFDGAAGFATGASSAEWVADLGGAYASAFWTNTSCGAPSAYDLTTGGMGSRCCFH